ncbi:MAG: hypothetical protein CME88_07790 [Hirschia sp.]|nr:hypothetical protein [Hirschia sp.]MBF18259.1 hypothetical protein [Hirschia sp.]
MFRGVFVFGVSWVALTGLLVLHLEDQGGQPMLRDAISKRLDHDPRFTWRGGQVTRIENLSDIVFALALGMLVSSSAAVVTFADLVDHLLNVIPVAAGFSLLLVIWNAHFVFFRRYGVADGRIIVLNAALLLIVLYLAYPLRFIFSSLFAYILYLFGEAQRIEAMRVGFKESGMIMAFFSIGYCMTYIVISMMYSHALKKADLLELNATERAMTLRSIWEFRIQVIIAAIAGVVAITTPLAGGSGALLILIWPISAILNRIIKLPDSGESTGEATEIPA